MNDMETKIISVAMQLLVTNSQIRNPHLRACCFVDKFNTIFEMSVGSILKHENGWEEVIDLLREEIANLSKIHDDWLEEDAKQRYQKLSTANETK